MLDDILHSLFIDDTLYGYSPIDDDLKARSGCKCALVTFMPFPDMERKYSPDEFFEVSNELSKLHSMKMNEIKKFLESRDVRYFSPAAAPRNDGAYWADFSYKWAAVHSGLGFIGKNDVFVHCKFGQRVRISCLLIDIDLPAVQNVMASKCGDCDLCVKACPYHNITGKQWELSVKRDELIDFKLCASKSRHSGDGRKYLCCHCVMACPWHMRYDVNNELTDFCW